MTAKEYLSTYKTIILETECLKEEIMCLRAAAEYTSPDLQRTGTGAASYGDRLGARAAKIIDTENALLDKISLLVDAGDNVRRLIDAVPDPQCRMILSQRYLSCKNWEQIAALLNFDLRWVYRLHNKALKMVEEGQEFKKIAELKGCA